MNSLSGLQGITNVNGRITINQNPSLTNLSGLDNLTSVVEYVSIQLNFNLSNFTGLGNLTYIGGNLTVYGNNTLLSLSGLNNITISGNLNISNNTALPNLSGLENALIGGNIHIENNNALSSLTGLNNLTSIGGYLCISNNNILTNLTGLNNLTSIGGGLWIGHTYYPGNPALTSLTGLNNLSSIGGEIFIKGNNILTSLTGLSNLTSVGGYFKITDNNALPNLIGFENLTSIGSYLWIQNNPLLANITALDNLNAGTISSLYIIDNASLTTCNAQGICDFLVSPNGSVNIYNNASGCNNPPEIASACGVTITCLPYGNYYFFTQTQINNFQSNYTGCTEIGGNVQIIGDDITNLNGLNVMTGISGHLTIGSYNGNPVLTSISGLSNVTYVGGNLLLRKNTALPSLAGLGSVASIGGDFKIWNNDALTGLSGLDNVVTIGGYLNFDGNDALTNVTGLNNLTTIGGYLEFDYNPALTNLSGLNSLTSIGEDLYIEDNDALTSLTGLSNVTSIGGELVIYDNEILSSLTGLDNINAGTISDLYITYNYSLSTCEVQSVCNYLASPNGDIEIYDNDDGCDDEDEVIAACAAAGFQLDLTVFLEGPFNITDMNTNLYPDEIPTSQPYNNSSWNYAGSENVPTVPAGVVDWLLIELRDAASASTATGSTMISQQAAFLLNNGSVVGLNGSDYLDFSNTINHNMYVVIWHRNHLGIMSATALTESGGIYSYDFTTSASQAHNSGQVNLGTAFGMIAADVNADGEINSGDKTIWTDQAGNEGYKSADMNMNTQVNNQDKNNKWLLNITEECQVPE
ncbi:MAG: leucine-rich repeat protein [Bacteroidetes bacterium]|nr:leucine-rich repeat protein [Bacteroidota bacterium]